MRSHNDQFNAQPQRPIQVWQPQQAIQEALNPAVVVRGMDTAGQVTAYPSLHTLKRGEMGTNNGTHLPCMLAPAIALEHAQSCTRRRHACAEPARGLPMPRHPQAMMMKGSKPQCRKVAAAAPAPRHAAASPTAQCRRALPRKRPRPRRPAL
eukprot:151074-Chlamydomonas_euryale.AAC.3